MQAWTALNRHPRLLVVLAVAVALRCLWAFAVPVHPVSDGFLYEAFAQSLASGRGYAYPAGNLTAYWPVGTSAVYALLIRLFGESYFPLLALNVLLGLAMAALTWQLAARAVGHREAVAASAIVACWPVLIQFTTVLASELLFTTLLLAAVLAFGDSAQRSWRRDALWALLLAASAFVRPTSLALFALMPFAAFIWTRQGAQLVRTLIIGAVVAAAVIGPWAWRNQAVFGSPALISTNFGPNLWMGNNSQSQGGYMPLPERPVFDNEVDRDRHFRALAFNAIAEDPLRYLRLCLRRLVTTHDRETIGVAWNESALRAMLGASGLTALKLGSTAYWYAVVVLAAAGLWSSVRRGRAGPLRMLLLVSAFLVAMPVLTVAQDRYHLPLNPFLAVLAGIAVIQIVDAWRRRRSASRLTTAIEMGIQ